MEVVPDLQVRRVDVQVAVLARERPELLFGALDPLLDFGRLFFGVVDVLDVRAALVVDVFVHALVLFGPVGQRLVALESEDLAFLHVLLRGVPADQVAVIDHFLQLFVRLYHRRLDVRRVYRLEPVVPPAKQLFADLEVHVADHPQHLPRQHEAGPSSPAAYRFLSSLQ